MKKLMSLILAVMMAVVLLCGAAFADEENELPEPEGGKKFGSNWALMGALAQIVYEEEGYRVMIEMIHDGAGTVWAYNCYYHEETDELQSISSSKTTYTLDLETFEPVYAEPAYEDFDGEGEMTTFAINAEGKLVWNDGRENAGADLEFQNIGNFEGMWRNEAEQVWAEISWNGLYDEDAFWYTVHIHRGSDAQYTEFLMNGEYNTETGKLECMGTAMSFILTDGEYVTEEDGENYDAFFSMMDNGNLLFEAANGIELEYDITYAGHND